MSDNDTTKLESLSTQEAQSRAKAHDALTALSQAIIETEKERTRLAVLAERKACVDAVHEVWRGHVGEAAGALAEAEAAIRARGAK